MSVAVRELCDFTARRGDLDHRFTPAPSFREGIDGHAQVVARRGEGYRSEVAVEGTLAGLHLRGRIDGVADDGSRLEEIKTHRGRLARMADNQRALHWAQVRAYGALWCRQQRRERITLALVYLDLVTGRETLLSCEASASQLWQELAAACHDYLHWAKSEARHRRRRDSALQGLRFPYLDFRPGQRQMAEATYKAVATGKALLVEAPTGIGKTLGSLFPALKAMPRHGLDRVAFLTMKTTGRQLALSAVNQLDPGPERRLRVLELVARDKACEHPDLACHGDSCPLAQGFYDRLPQARQAAVAHARLDRAGLREVALAHRLCPYYLGQEMARWCDLVVGDVNHYFDSSALLHGLAQARQWRLALLVDEAHNLIDRARGMYSASIDQRSLARLSKEAPAALKQPLARVVRQWQAVVREHGGDQPGSRDAPRWMTLGTIPAEFLQALQGLSGAIGDHLGEHPEDTRPALTDALFEALAFSRLAERFGDHSMCELTRRGRGRARLAIVNQVPGDFLAPRFAAAHASVLFSATLAPPRYQQDLLGLPAHSVWAEVESPFTAEQLDVRICTHLSTRYRHREQSLPGIIEMMAAQYQRRPGHYLAFFSSFAYLDRVVAAMADAYPEIPRRVQRRGMDEAEREAFLADFAPGGCGIAFAVLGSVFSEGVDLPGDRLIGAFVATLGLPPSDARQEALKSRLEARFGQGDNYAYRIPGLIKVIQAAGRVIRGPEDSGTLVLLDDRFAWPEVRERLPSWWQPRQVSSPDP
ncbi:ATP-dependent DNA helicase [Halomonas sp. DP5Y7-2]|uniref:ATP-dependent DNA helicase n=1 Tax=Halomonas sp. DP5Y7-2 TaxID=2859076 RepID=UPI001C994386|nr:ATP-dependent DNA helicase [Halomonas sp. DP5Y7-2]MBY5983837.1 ATP-dependent DNA helicase [Halomonas sp. DP5Y7-2]